MISGDRPFIGASDSNNGITNFVSNTNKSLDSNVLGVNYNGSVCEGFYHPYKVLFSDDVKRLTFKKGINNEFTLQYLNTSISKQKDKYTYGYKFNATRMKKQRIVLPIKDNDSIDFNFMENLVKELKYFQIKKAINILD